MAFSKKKISWLVYDPAASAYALIVRTVFAPVFLAHFSQGILTGSQITSRWSLVASAAGIAAGIITVFSGPAVEVEAQQTAIEHIARYMRSKSFEYNQEHPNNEVILKDIKLMTAGDIIINEDAINNLRNDYKQHLPARPQKGAARSAQKPNNNKPGQKMQHGNMKGRTNAVARKKQ